jgi:hypothetical protein
MKKLLLIPAFLSILGSCAVPGIYKGTVRSIENGKDGYTASLENRKGEKFDAILSISKMGAGYRKLNIGEQVKLEGDTIHLNERFRVLVRKIR